MTHKELNRFMESDCVHKAGLLRNPGAQTQLLFNLTMPTCVHNRASQVCPPAPIVIEKLVPQKERQEDAESCSSSLRLSVLSEERLQAAVRLAKRDLRKKRQESISSLIHEMGDSPLNPNKSYTDNQQNGPSPKGVPKTGTPKTQTKSCSQVFVYTPQKPSLTQMPVKEQSSPTSNPGRSSSSELPLSREMRKLQKELAMYVQKIEQLVNKGHMGEDLQPEERRRIEIRRQEQAARSARILYVLQQQVKEIQEDLDQLRSPSVRHTKKSRAVDRLAAAHRGAVRAMQVFVNQLSDLGESGVPAQCQELGQLIRQLSLCSAKVDMGQGSSVPETTLDIMEKLETLDSALRKQENPTLRELRMRSVSPVSERIPRPKARSTSPPRAPRATVKKAAQGPYKPAASRKKGRRMPARPQRAARLPNQERSEVLKTGLRNLLHLRKLKEGGSPSRPELHTPNLSTVAAHPDKSKQGSHVCDAGFQQPTVSSKLRESEITQKAASVPWIPTSPHSPSKQGRALSNRPEPRCLFTPVKSSSQQTGVQTQSQGQAQGQDRGRGHVQGRGRGRTSTQHGAAGDMREGHNEAFRHAFLDRITEARLRELNELSKEETEHNRFRAGVGFPTHWAERTEQATQERLRPLLDQVEQVGEGQNKNGSSVTLRVLQQTAKKGTATVDPLSESLLDEQVEDTPSPVFAVEGEQDTEALTHRLLQEPLLERMLQRMEEMEKDEEAVRRRFAMISYSDPLFWERGDGAQRNTDSSRPTSPQVIRLTKPARRPSPSGEIIMQRPVETGIASESSMPDEEASAPVPRRLTPQRAEKKRGVHFTVPSNVMKDIQKYREDRDAYLHLVSHEAVGSFNPWSIAESLAEELLEEALADVAAEFQDACEEYSEAVFTSEFLKPIQSPPASVS